MPHLNMPELPGGEMRKGKHGQLERMQAWRLLKKEGQWVKTGMDNVVTQFPDDPNIYAYSFRTPEQGFRAKEIFYIHRVLHTLFPEHFPRIKAAFEQIEGMEPPGGTIREYVEKNPNVPRNDSPLNWFVRNYITHDTPGDFTSGPRDAFFRMGIEKDVDYNPPNFGVDMKHHEVYLDTAEQMAKPLFEHRLEILDFMNEEGYEPYEKEVVRKSLGRLGTLIDERPKK